jgi:hypothetical protein
MYIFTTTIVNNYVRKQDLLWWELESELGNIKREDKCEYGSNKERADRQTCVQHAH